MGKRSAKSVRMPPSSGNVFTDLRVPDAAELDAKVRLAVLINRRIKDRRLTRAKAAECLGVRPQQASSLKNYRLDGISVERLRSFLLALRDRTTGKTKPVPPDAPFRTADHLRSDAEIALYISEMLSDGDARAVPVALRTVADALGGIPALAEKTGLSREILNRTLSDKGNPRVDTLASILAAFGLCLSVRPAGKG